MKVFLWLEGAFFFLKRKEFMPTEGMNELAFLERKLSPNQRTKRGLLRNLGQVCFILLRINRYFASLNI
jgi:hypothetical protein